MLNIWYKLFLRRPFHDWELRAIIFNMRERLEVVVILSILYCLHKYIVLCDVLPIQRCIRVEKERPLNHADTGLETLFVTNFDLLLGNCIITDEIRYN